MNSSNFSSLISRKSRDVGFGGLAIIVRIFSFVASSKFQNFIIAINAQIAR